MRETYARSVGQRIIQYCTLCEKSSALGSICEATEGGGRNFVARGSLCKIVLAFLRVPLSPLQCKSAIQPPGAIALLILLPNKIIIRGNHAREGEIAAIANRAQPVAKKAPTDPYWTPNISSREADRQSLGGASPSQKLFIGGFSSSCSCIIDMGL